MPLLLPFTPRLITFTLLALANGSLLVALLSGSHTPLLVVAFAVTAALVFVGIYDLLQTEHALLRNYPIAGHLRFMLENVRPEIRQYFLEDDKSGVPFSRDERAIVYQRAKLELDKRPFGTELDVYSERYEWIQHSMVPCEVRREPFRINIGGPACTQPYSASVFNISAMSFGSLSANAIRALNRGAQRGGFAHDTGEGGFSPHHREGGDVIWEIGSGYFGARDASGNFSPATFAATASAPQIR